jgi:hypothetical protein
MWRATYLPNCPAQQKARSFLNGIWSSCSLATLVCWILKTNVVGRVHWKGDPVYHIGDTAFFFCSKRKVGIDDHAGASRTLIRVNIPVARTLKMRKFDASPWSRRRSSLDKATFEALTKNGLTLGYFLNRSSVRYLTLQERKQSKPGLTIPAPEAC